MSLKLNDFLRIAEYGNSVWKGSFTPEEVRKNAEDYFAEFKVSNKQGKATPTIQELCKLLIEDMKGNSEEAEKFLFKILENSGWTINVYICEHCHKREIVFFSKEERYNIWKYENEEMKIQDAIPDKPQWVRDFFETNICLCPKCWDKYWSGAFKYQYPY